MPIRLGRGPLPKRQHHVAQFLLRNFAANDKDQIHVFDKSTGKQFTTSVINAAVEKDFYNMPHSVTAWMREKMKADGKVKDVYPFDLSYEPALGAVESAAADAIAEILRSESLGGMPADARRALGNFAGTQYLRGPAQRSRSRQIGDAVRLEVGNVLEAMGYERESGLVAAGLPPASEDEEVMLGLSLLDAAPKFAPYFIGRELMLLRAPKAEPFWISDNPICLEATVSEDAPMYLRSLGPAHADAQITLPISPAFALLFTAPNLVKNIRDSLGGGHAERIFVQPPTLLRPYLSAITSGAPFDLDTDHVRHLNNQQARRSHRFVYGSTDRLKRIGELIAKDDSVRHGPHVRVSAGRRKPNR